MIDDDAIVDIEAPADSAQDCASVCIGFWFGLFWLGLAWF
jgi:hypothetical protein